MHWPEALQVEGPVYTSATQVSGEQTVVPAGYLRQAPVPSHFPSVPQLVAKVSLQVARGSEAPLAARVHLPRLPVSAQLRQAPVQGVLQQMPSTQFLFWHSVLATHFCPSSFGPQVPRTQAIPSAQSAFTVHFELQALLAHLKLPQLCTSEG